MKQSILRAFALVLGLWAGMSAHSSVQAQSADRVFDQLKAKYRSVQSIQASFTQTMTSEFTDESSTASGRIVMQGNKYRVETPTQTLVTDGKVTWVYVPADKQVLVNDYVADETTFTLNDFFSRQATHYKATAARTASYRGTSHAVLTLKPKDADAFFTEVVLWAQPGDGLVRRAQVVDVNGTRMDITLDDIRVNPRIEARTFTFVAPRNVEVVDLRS